MQGNMKFSERMGELVRRLLSCCDTDVDDNRPALKISAPTNFRREDVSIPELSEMQQTYIREIAKQDAKQMYEGLQPLRSSPSGTFAEKPAPPFYDDVAGRRPGSPRSPASLVRNRESRLDRVRAHSRKISDALTRPMSFMLHEQDSKHELRALMGDDALIYFAPSAKMSTESFSVAGSEEEKMSRNRF